MSTRPAPLEGLQVFFGAASAAEARVYVVLPASDDDVRLRGRVEGPRSMYARTLPASTSLADRGSSADGTRLAEAVVADPCFWSPDSPLVYDVRIEVLRGDRVVAEVRRSLGLRLLGVQGSGFVFEGKNWTLRGVEQRSVRETPLAQWRELGAAMVVDDPGESLLIEASRVGVLVVARRRTGTAEQVATWARHAAVGLVLFDVAEPIDFDPRPLARNVVWGQQIHESRSFARSAWVQSVFAPPGVDGAPTLPLVAHRPLSEPTDLATARAACDALQRELAGRVDAAGYIV